MRKILMTLLVTAFMLAPVSGMAKGPGDKGALTGGFSGPMSGVQAETVAKALELPDDAPVMLTGNIVSQIAGKKKKFLFKDATGEIRVEIDRKAFGGLDITPQDTVQIIGKMDKDFGENPEIEVK